MALKMITHEEAKAELFKNPEVRRAYEELEPVYQLTRLRIQRGLTQQQLAERVGTTQSSIARLERGKTKPTLETLERIATALGGRVRVSIEPEV